MRPSRQCLFDAMSNGAVLITPNNRLSNQLLHDYMLDHSTPCLTKPRCLPYPAFLHHLFHAHTHAHPHTPHPLILSAQQLRVLWRHVLTDSRELPCNDGLLDAAIEAWTACQDWQLDSNHSDFQTTTQTRQFQHWQHTVEERLNALNALAECQLVSHFLTLPSLPAISSMVWVCFDDYTPAQRALQAAFSASGCEQSYHDFTDDLTHASRLEAQDTTDEYQQLIHWLTLKRAAGERRIGVVIPDLVTEAIPLDRLLKRHFSSEDIDLSLGRSLMDYSLVSHAIQWLRLDTDRISNHQLRLLLHSPYVAHAETEFHSRAQFMQQSALLQEPFTPLSTFKTALTHTAPLLKQTLDQLLDYPLTETVGHWVNHFKQRLTALGFPGSGALNSATYQCFQRFSTLLDELQTLAVITSNMTQAEALDAMEQLAKTTIFQPQKTNSPIQILGLLEASGCTFDSLWVTGMTDQCLPQKTRLSAFIPIELQRALDMPHANATRELRFATQTIRRLQRGSPARVFSYPRLIGDRPCMPSPFIRDLSVRASEPLAPPALTTPLVSREDNYLLPLNPTERATGGTTLLANQAKCPFRAFAAHRLHAKPEPRASEGLNPMERGQLIHQILESLWHALRDQKTLLAYPPIALESLIQHTIDATLKPFSDAHPLSFPPLIQSVERARLTRLVNASLTWDRQRPPFAIEALEHAASIELAGLTFHIKIDRIDRMDTQKLGVIDYKSRLPASLPWLDTRPEAPQLLLYALLDERICTLLFMELKQGQVTCSGFSDEPTSLPGIRTAKPNEPWAAHQARWRSQLTELALEFQTGHCPPTPTRSNTCTTCEFQNLCRVSVA